MPVLLLSFVLSASGKLEVDEEPIEVKIPKITERPDVAVKEALEVIKNPASDAALHEAARVCALLGIDVTLAMAAAKSGPADKVEGRMLQIADVYLGFGDWVNAERALKATKTSARVHERMGHALRGQNRFADAAKAYVAAIDSTSGPELDEIVGRIAPVTNDWVLLFEAGHDATLKNAAKAVLAALLPHQAGEGSETTKKLQARLDAAPDKSFRSTLTATRFEDALAVQVPALRACFARALVKEPELKGKLELKFTVDLGGKITGLTTSNNTSGSKPLASCFETRIKALHLATDTGTEVTLPFALTPL